ncbi:MAG: hypothetical protein ACOCP4_04805 [Candidatus Woesearchaeota archaeon]
MNYIITSATRNYLEFLYEFLFSLFMFGKFDGIVKILYYYEDGETFDFIEKFNSFKNIEFINKKKKFLIVNQRFVDIKEELNGLNNNDKVALYDSDIWFQDDVSSLFLLDTENKCYYCTEAVPWFITKKEKNSYFGYANNALNRFKTNQKKYRDKIFEIIEKYGSHINGGFLYSSVYVLKNKVNTINQLLLDGVDYLNTLSLDQLATNISTSLDNDEFIMNTYNYCLTGVNVLNIDLDKLELNNKKIKVLHYNERVNPPKVKSFHDFRFINYYEKLLKE